MIPQIIHQTWKTDRVPDNVYNPKWRQSWHQHHSGWRYFFWTDETIRREIEKHRPNLMPVFEARIGVARSQLCRYLAMYVYGGLYVDLDYECFRSFEPLRDRDILFVNAMPGEQYVSDALLMAEPLNPFYSAVMDECIIRHEAGEEKYPTIEQMLSFVMLTEMVMKHNLGDRIQPAELFSPFNWIQQDAIANGMTTARIQEVLAAHPQAYAATYWTHNWRRKY